MNAQELEDFSEEQQTELLRANEGLMKNYHNTERQSWIIQEKTQIIKIQGYVNFWTGPLFTNSVIILSCGVYIYIYIYICKHMLCEIALFRGVLNENNMQFSWFLLFS